MALRGAAATNASGVGVRQAPRSQVFTRPSTGKLLLVCLNKPRALRADGVLSFPIGAAGCTAFTPPSTPDGHLLGHPQDGNVALGF